MMNQPKITCTRLSAHTEWDSTHWRKGRRPVPLRNQDGDLYESADHRLHVEVVCDDGVVYLFDYPVRATGVESDDFRVHVLIHGMKLCAADAISWRDANTTMPLAVRETARTAAVGADLSIVFGQPVDTLPWSRAVVTAAQRAALAQLDVEERAAMARGEPYEGTDGWRRDSTGAVLVRRGLVDVTSGGRFRLNAAGRAALKAGAR